VRGQSVSRKVTSKKNLSTVERESMFRLRLQRMIRGLFLLFVFVTFVTCMLMLGHIGN
jgi:hypothetical protein